MSAFLIVAAMWLLPSALIVAWIKADEWLDARYAAEQPEREVVELGLPAGPGRGRVVICAPSRRLVQPSNQANQPTHPSRSTA